MAKIVHFGKYYYPDTGGIETVTLQLAQRAANEGYFVSVVCFGKSIFNEMEVSVDVRVIRAPVAMLLAAQPLSLKYFFQLPPEVLSVMAQHRQSIL